MLFQITHRGTNNKNIFTAVNGRGAGRRAATKKLRRKPVKVVERAAVAAVAPPPGAAVRPGQRGRVRKPRRALNISGLELLHSHTLTSTQQDERSLPPPPGCVDQRLSSLSSLAERTEAHAELDIPDRPRDTPYALQLLLDMFKTQYMSAMESMRRPEYKKEIQAQIDKEMVCILILCASLGKLTVDWLIIVTPNFFKSSFGRCHSK